MKNKNTSSKNKGMALIKKSNDLIESRYKFDVWEMRFFLSVLSKIEKSDQDFDVYRIKYRDVIKDFDIKSNRSYELLKEAAKSIMDKSVTINYEEKGVVRGEKYHVIRKVNYLESVTDSAMTHLTEHEYIDVTIEPELKPFLLQLSKNFTAYDLKNVAKLGSYSIRIYELLKQYESIGVRKLGIDEMKQMLEVVKEYPLFGNFYQSVIEPSIKEINKCTDLKVMQPQKIKDGRKVIALVFKFSKKVTSEIKKVREEQQKPQTRFDYAEKPMTENVIEEAEVIEEKKVQNTDRGIEVTEAQEKLIIELSTTVVIKFGVSLKVFMSLVEKHTEGEIRQAIQVTEKAIQTGKVDNCAGFFVGALKNNYQDAALLKKKTEDDSIAEKKAKAATLKKIETDTNEQKKQTARNESNRKIGIIKNLVQTNAPLIQRAIDELRQGMFRGGYDPTKTVEENLESAMFVGALMNVIEKMKPTVFQE